MDFSILSHASSTSRPVRYSPYFLISFSFNTLNVSPGNSGPYTSAGSKIYHSSSRDNPYNFAYNASSSARITARRSSPPFERRKRNTVIDNLRPFRRCPLMPASRGFVCVPLLAKEGLHNIIGISPCVIGEGFDVQRRLNFREFLIYLF